MRLPLPPLLLVLLLPAAVAAQTPAPPRYDEIPYYLRKLREADQEGKKVEFAKAIHDAVVNAPLWNRRVARSMDPVMEDLRSAIADGLDRANLVGEKGWIESAVMFYEAERGRPVVESTPADWMGPQTRHGDTWISVYPGRILLHGQGETVTLVQDEGIHEAILSPNGRRLAYFKKGEGGEPAREIWGMDVRKKRRRKIADVPSCKTILFDLKGKWIFYQEGGAAGAESPIRRIKFGGGKAVEIAEGVLLETVVERGRHRGALVLYKKRLDPMASSFRTCPYLFDARGREIGRVAGLACR